MTQTSRSGTGLMGNVVTTFHLGMRKNVQDNNLLYWLLVKGKSKQQDDENKFVLKETKRSFVDLYLALIESRYWNAFVTLSVVLNIVLFLSYFWWNYDTIQTILIIMILTSVIYWIDFIGTIIDLHRRKRTRTTQGSRKAALLILDALSLLPASEMSLILSPLNYDKAWKLRAFSVIRVYRIPHYFGKMAMAEATHWKILMGTYGCYMLFFAVAFCNLFLWGINGYSEIRIENWNSSTSNRVAVSSYYVIQIILNVAYGDIRPISYVQMFINCTGMVFGTAMTTGVLTGIMATAYVNRWKRREMCRSEYEVTMSTLKERKVDKKVLDKVLDNMAILWKYKKGYLSQPRLNVLPLSFQKEIFFDINFGLLHRSLIFSTQPRAFLRSVTIFMKNMSYLPGDVILEAYEISESMICVATGVIEVLSEENDETVLFSLTTGTIVGEASLFLSIPTKCIVRASTYVELQVLMKNDFSRLALTYPEIFRSMRVEILSRLSLISNQALFVKNFDTDVKELSRRKETKKFLKKLRGYTESMAGRQYNVYRKGFLNLYVLSENIPKVKTLPVNLIRARPWILRPETPFLKVWDSIIVVFAVIYCILIPIWSAFYRKIEDYMRIYNVLCEIVFLLDIYLMFTTAVEKDDHFTYVTRVRDIVIVKLKTWGFYMDVLATYHLGVYSSYILPENPEYASLILSFNGMFKIWKFFYYVRTSQDDVKHNLVVIITIKFCIYFFLLIIWSGVLLYLEACPGDTCEKNRWLGALEIEESQNKDPTPLYQSPMTTSMYFGTVSLFTLGYGDIIVRSIPDCLVVIFLMILGDFFINLCMAQMSSFYKHLERPKTDYQEEMFAVEDLMKEHEIPEVYQSRVMNYLRVQWEYDKGYSLKRTSLTEVLPTLQKRVIMLELMKAFSTVTMFRNCNPDFLKLLAKISRVRVLPPGEDISEYDSLVREMYILENGFCEAWGESDSADKKILGPMNIIGCYEMITEEMRANPHFLTLFAACDGSVFYLLEKPNPFAGKAQPLSVRTLTHARIISLSYSGYLRAVTKYPSVKVQIDDLLKTDTQIGTMHTLKPVVIPQYYKATLERQKKILSKALINVYKYHNTISVNYWKPFTAWGKFRFCQFFVLPFAIAPHSAFIKVWMTVRLLIVFVIGFLGPVWFSLLGFKASDFVVMMQLYFVIDMYLMFHVAYYDTAGLLIYHPSKTVIRYLRGNFILDLIGLCPMYWLIRVAIGEYSPEFLKEAIGFFMVLLFYKFYQVCAYLESDILMKTDQIKIFKFVPSVVIVINCLAGALILIQCTDKRVLLTDQFLKKTPLSKDLRHGLYKFCNRSTNRVKLEPYEQFQLYLLMVYWVCETLLGCGYGDLTAYNDITMIASIIIIIAGIFFFTFLFASITGSMVNTDVPMTQYRIRMIRMIRFFRVKKLPQTLQKRMIKHYEYKWQRTEGATPQEIFTFVHLCLREKIFNSMYGQTVKKNPAFKGMEKQIISVIGKNLSTLSFLKGETIIKFNDVQENIYLVYKGEVAIFDRDGMFKASMGNGGLFGNLSNASYSLSREEMVAEDNVDLLILDAKTFHNTLKVFPNTVRLLRLLRTTKENYILPNRGDSLERIVSAYRINLFHLEWPSKTVDKSDSFIKGNFYFKRMIYKTKGNILTNFIILPHSKLNSAIEMSFLIISLLSSSLAIYMFCYQDFNTALLVSGYVLDVAFICELFLNFHMAYFDRSGYCVVDLRRIKTRYLNSRNIVYDLVSSAPWDLFGYAASADWTLPSVTLLRLNRVLKIYNVFNYFKKERQKLMVNKIYLQSGWILVSFLLLIHFLSCFWYLGCCPLGKCPEPNWISRNNLTGKSKLELYFYSSFYVLVIVTTTGYQVIELVRPTEVIISILFMILCRFLVVVLSGVLVAAINAQSLSLFLFQETTEELINAFRRQKLSAYQMIKLSQYLTSLWLVENGKQMPKFIVSAPYALKCDIMIEMYGTHLSQSYLFSNLNPAFVRQLASCLRRYVYFPGNYIVYQGDIDNTMYFIHKGDLSILLLEQFTKLFCKTLSPHWVVVLTIHADLLDTVHFKLTDSDHFGFKQGILPGYPHNFTYRAETKVEIVMLTLKDWQHLLKYFPEEAGIIIERVEGLPAEVQSVSSTQ